jgi:hypothetical protein
MFGCGNYPAFKGILQSIGNECISNVSRLRHHPSIVVYAGNNEDYQVQESFGLTYNYEDKDPNSWLQTDFPARYIYEKVSTRYWKTGFVEPANFVSQPVATRNRCCRESTRALPPRIALGRWIENFEPNSG